VLLSEEDPGDIRAIAEKADRLASLHVPQHHDTVAAVADLTDEETEVAAVKSGEKKKQFKKKKRGNKKLHQSSAGTTPPLERRHTSASPLAAGRKTSRPGRRAICRQYRDTILRH
jgi:hypothetical protein